MTQENGIWVTGLDGDTAVIHANVRSPKGTQYLDIKVDITTGNVEITKNFKTWEK